MDIFSKNLALLRQRKGLKQKECSELLGLKSSSWNNWERGISTPKVEVLVEISDFLGVNTDQLLKVDLSKIPADNIVIEPQHRYSNESCTSCTEKQQLIKTQQALIDSLQAQIELLKTQR